MNTENTTSQQTAANAEMYNMLTDAALQLGRLSGENLAIYARTFAVLAAKALANSKEANARPIIAAPTCHELILRAINSRIDDQWLKEARAALPQAKQS